MLNKNLISEMKTTLRKFVFSVIFSFFAAIATVAEFWSVAHIVNDIFILKYSMTEVRSWFYLAFVSLILKQAFEYFSEFMAGRLSIDIQEKIRANFLATFLQQSPVNTKSYSIGKLMNVFFEGIDTLDRYYREYVPQLVKSLLIPVVFLVFIFPRDWISGVIMLLTLPLIPFFMILIGKWTRNITERQWFLLSQLSGYLQDVLRGLETLKILGRSKEQAKKINSVSDQYRLMTLKVQRWAFLSSLALELLSTISIALVAVGLGLRLVEGQIMYLPAFFILLIAPEYYQPMRELGSFFHASMDADAAAQDIYDILKDMESNVKTDKEMEPFESLRFEGVSFKYKESQSAVLTDISFTLHSGERLALVGKSGSGKTTLMNLALGFLEPSEGKILLNDKPLSYYGSGWIKNVTVIPQDTMIFSGTLAENIALVPKIQEEELISEAIHQSGLDLLFQEELDPYHILIGQSGRKLSGGQKALVAFSRAFYQNRSVIFMDEPTDNLDLVSEKRIISALNRLLKNKASLTIAHRLHTIRQADKILLLDNGRLFAQGTYDELAKNNALFQSFMKGEADEKDCFMVVETDPTI